MSDIDHAAQAVRHLAQADPRRAAHRQLRQDERMIPDSPAVLDHGAIAATLGCIAVACHLTGWRELARGILGRLAAAARRAARPLRLFARHTGRHRDKLHMTPAQPAANSAGRVPGLDLVAAGPVPAMPAPREADSAGQVPDAATTPAPRVEAAPLPQPHAVPPSADGLGQPTDAPRPGPPIPGPGCHPFDAPAAVTRDWQYWPRDGQDPYAPADPGAPRLVLPAPIEMRPLWDELIEVTDGTGPRAVIWPLAEPSARTTGHLAALGDLPPVCAQRCTTDIAAVGDDLIRALRML